MYYHSMLLVSTTLFRVKLVMECDDFVSFLAPTPPLESARLLLVIYSLDNYIKYTKLDI
jgi:hypothetical protein